jgi:hypothetical protein
VFIPHPPADEPVHQLHVVFDMAVTSREAAGAAFLEFLSHAPPELMLALGFRQAAILEPDFREADTAYV